MAHPGFKRVTLLFMAALLIATVTPAVPASAKILDDSTPCSAFAGCTSTAVQPTEAGCTGADGNAQVWATQTCTANNADANAAASKPTAWEPGKVGKVINQLNKIVVSTGANVAFWILNTELGSKNAFTSPKLVCTNCADKNSWFVGQLAVIRSIGLYFIIPLLMLVVIQSVVRGSLYFLLRAVLIMLPVAVLGGVIFAAMAQLMVNISDDMANAIANYTTSYTEYGQGLKDTINSTPNDKFGLLFALWIYLFEFAAVGVFVELVLRDVGVYLSTLFLPLAFAALVWPPASKYARRLSELLLGLIFSKVFIIAALSLGLAAFYHPNTKGGNTTNGKQTDTAVALSSVMTGTIVMLMSAFAGAKILSFTPAAVGAAEGYIMNRRQIAARGNWTQGRLGAYQQRRQNRLNQIAPNQRFTNPSRP